MSDSPTGDVDLDALLALGTDPVPVKAAAPDPIVATPPIASAPVATATATATEAEAEPVVAAPAGGIVTPPKPARPTPAVTEDQLRIRELEHQLAIQETAKLEKAVDGEAVAVGDHKILIHFLEDGFTCSGRVWYKGQELEFDVPGLAYTDTLNTLGVSWLDMAGDDAAQMAHYGKVWFRVGPWPGNDWDDSEAAAKERARRRAVPLPAAR